MDSIEYNDKINDIVNDTENYKVIQNDPTASVERKLRQLLNKWKINNFIN